MHTNSQLADVGGRSRCK